MSMKRAFSFLFLLSFVTACTTPTGVSTSSSEIPPTPFPDTPAPAVINAPLVESPALVAISFFNELDGWGMTETQIVRTNDGGITWYNVTPPDLTEAGYSVDLFVLDAHQAWIQNPDFDNFPNSGFMHRTSDGGITWTKTATPFSRAHITFLDSNHAWALADLGVGAGSNAVSVYQTSDGGATWLQTYTNDPNNANAKESLPLGGLKSGLAPVNMQTAFVHGVVYSQGTVYLFRTDDGGANWNAATLPLPVGAENYELSIDQMRFVSSVDGYIVMRLTGENYQTALYVTHDGGNTWSLAPALVQSSGSADFLSATELMLYIGGQFHVTRDAAQSWDVASPDVVFGDAFAMMDFVNTLTGWVITLDPATGHRSLYRTTDGGATWSPLIP
jgi:photosystem II stability/assembly factor-like uncharacterized protein